jgi:hypothetical protein
VLKQGDVHVVRDNSSGWQVRIEGTARPRSTHKTQTEAAKAGRDIARKNKSELLVHGRDGKIRERSTFRPRSASDEGLAVSEHADQFEERDEEEQGSRSQEGTEQGNRESGSGPDSQGDAIQDQPGTTEDPSAD